MRKFSKAAAAMLAATLLFTAACGQGTASEDGTTASTTTAAGHTTGDNGSETETATPTDNDSNEGSGEGSDETDAPETPGAEGGAVADPEVPNLNREGFPIVEEKITLTAMVNQTAVQPDFNEILIWDHYEDLTNIHIEWDSVPSTSIAERRNLALATNDLPDLFYRSSMGEEDLAKYGPEGSFIALNDLIDTYAPNFAGIMAEFEDVRKGVPMADGMIYAFPGLSNTLPVEINPKLYINTAWLEAVGHEMPTTTDEFYEMLTAFKNDDPNGNGEADEIPWTSSTLEHIFRTLRGSWGLGNRGFGGGYWDINPETDELRFMPFSPEYREMLEFINKLYSEGLIDEEIFTMNLEQVLAKSESDTIGSFSFTNTAAASNTYEENYRGLEVALEGPHGDQMWAGARAHIAGKGAFIITEANEHPEASVRWIDYFYGDEGAKLVYMGIEGETYHEVEEGVYELLPEIVDNIPEGSSFDQVVSQFVPYAGGGLPTMSNEQVFKGGEMQPIAYEAAMNMLPFIPEERWAPFSYTPEESEQNSEILADLGAFITQNQAEFIQGSKSFDEFEAFVEEARGMRFDSYAANVEAAYERYQFN